MATAREYQQQLVNLARNAQASASPQRHPGSGSGLDGAATTAAGEPHVDYVEAVQSW